MMDMENPFENDKNICYRICIAGDIAVLSDEGQTIHRLVQNGLVCTTEKTDEIKRIVARYGVHLENDSLTLSTNVHALPAAQNLLLKAVFKLNSTFFALLKRVFAVKT